MANKASIYMIVVVLCIFLLPGTVFSDNVRTVDSLQRIVDNSTGRTKLLAYRELISSFRNINPAFGIARF